MSSSLEKNETVVSQRSSNSSSTVSLDQSISYDETNHENLLNPTIIEKTTVRTHSHKGKLKVIKINSIDKYQLELSIFVLLSVFILNKFEVFVPYTSKFLTLQYKYPDSDTYDIGINDIWYVLYWTVASTFVRAFVMNYILGPVAINLLNIRSSKAVQRFKEQGWYLIYYCISAIFGGYIYYNSSYFGNIDNFYIDWPHDKLEPISKKYYLMELACWLQQIFTLNVEAKRKDHIQMFSHHIITCLLVIGSYYYYFTRIGNVILCMMDFIDIFLALAKVLKYCGFQQICDAMFVWFVITWIVLRHGFYNYILYHLAFKGRSLMESGRCVVGIVQKRCFTDRIITIFVYLLGGLQILFVIWMFLIIKVVVKVVTGKGADDVRSDGEDDDDDED